MDIKGYEDCPEKYYFSSSAAYLKFRKGPFGVLEEEYILSIFGRKKSKARELYMKLVMKVKTLPVNDVVKEEAEFEHEKTEYRSERRIIVRNFDIQHIIKYISEIFNIEKALIHFKYQKEFVSPRAILVVLLRSLCNLTQKDICSLLGNITSSRVSKLSSLGVGLIRNDERYKNRIGRFIDCYS
jgi:chromosomal replication initiation ATPase DnaA